ncbi:MAG: SusD/RagB family nutrient-binding outer membrane lipoprotein [Prevotellaceae bacterium]|jgi:hypothetical protein|nr:SusD/RagB family nutrient-binding outer membrane lipoprotein [Prevotellaceae bacterium]
MTKNITLLLLLVTSVLSACSDWLDEVNQNPNATENPQPAYLLTGIQKQGADLYWGAYSGFGSTLLFVQHWAEIQYPEADRYNFSNTSPAIVALWNTGYATLITDLNTILDFPDETANATYKGVALTLRSWVFLLLTDTYGDIPYREVGKSLVPVYDAQKDVYTGLLADLTQAVGLLNANGGNISGDVVYGGDVTKWRKFANSLKLRIALRIADKEEAPAKQTIAALSPSDLIGSNDEAFRFIYASSPQHNPQAAAFDTRDDYRVSKTIIDKLKALNDPRLPVYAQQPSDTSAYIGAGNGLSASNAAAQGLTKTSRPGTYFLTPAAPAVIYSYAEVLFNLAEAVERKYITGNAEDYYKQAITASLQQFGITDATTISDYLAQSSVQYNATSYKQSIGEQKWIAFFGQGLDAFAEWRRLDYPQLTPGPAAVLNGKIPLRFFYPGAEQSLNGKNRSAAVARQGEDLLTTKLWFDVN